MYHPRGPTVLAWRARVGYGDSYGRSPTVPVEERFYLGGGNSVRGYAEASLGPRTGVGVDSSVDGGQFMMLANLEFRYPLPYFGKWNFSGTFFFDGGNVWAEVSDVSATDFRLTSSVSETTVDDFRTELAGIRYNTPIGPIASTRLSPQAGSVRPRCR
jgi:outer membrane protein insertion porin family